jgi:SAM-dependent methyltransferase
VLVPGSGTGHDVREISRYPASEVVGVDIAVSAMSRARSYPTAGHEIYVLGDFLAGDAQGLGKFDALVEHTCFCAIHPTRREDYAREAAAVLSSGGLLVGVFYGNPDNPEPDSPPFESPEEVVKVFFARDFEVIEESSPIPTYPGREGREYLMVLRRR